MIPVNKLNIVESDFSSGTTTKKSHGLNSFHNLHYDCSVGTDCVLHVQQSAFPDFWTSSDYTLLTLHGREAGAVPLKAPYVRTWLSTVDGSDPSGTGLIVRFQGDRGSRIAPYGHRTIAGGTAGLEDVTAGRNAKYAYLDHAKNVTVYGLTNEPTLVITPEVSHDLTNWYPHSSTITADPSGYFHGDLTVNTDFLTLNTSIDCSLTAHIDWRS